MQADITSFPSLSFVFLGNDPPATGKYTTTFLPTSADEVAMQLFMSISNIYQDLGSDTVYVTNSSGQITIITCSIPMTNPSTFDTTALTCKIIKP